MQGACREGVTSIEDFQWQAELRYAWSDATDEIVISQVWHYQNPMHKHIVCLRTLFMEFCLF